MSFSSVSSSFLGRALTAAAAASLLLGGAANAQSTCNGHAELCTRSYSNITYIGTHNSYSVQQGSIAANQNYDVTTQLDNGVRLLQNQGHDNDGAIHLCHSSCLLLDAGTIQAYLQKVKSWLDANPTEVVTILWVNQDSIPVSQWGAAYTATGLDAMSYVPPTTPLPASSWPTLQDMISSGKRLVTFMDYQADYSSVPYILDHFTHFWETPYNSLDASFPCIVDRGSADTGMYMVNHYLDTNLTFFGSPVPVPDTANLETTNAASSLEANAGQCSSQHGQNPTFMLVDFYDVGGGSVFEAAASLNGVSYTAESMGNGTSVAAPSGGSNLTTTTTVSGGTSGRSGSISSSTDNTGDASRSPPFFAGSVAAMGLLAAAVSAVVSA